MTKGSELTLRKLKKGDKATVEKVLSTNQTLCSKLVSMGIVAGTLIEVLGIAPLGDPIEIKAKGYKLSLRKSEADQVIVLKQNS
jgi:Fe2+ transport system protein FeoA